MKTRHAPAADESATRGGLAMGQPPQETKGRLPEPVAPPGDPYRKPGDGSTGWVARQTIIQRQEWGPRNVG